MLAVALSFLFFLFAGVPIAFVLGFSSLVYMLVNDNTLLLGSLAQRMVSSLQNYGLLAIPMFVLVGELMNAGGITTRLVHFAKVLLAHFRGGLAYVNVLANMFLASILGSANAQTAMMSKVMVPAMEKEGYRRDFSLALTVSSSLMGPIIPPSLMFIVYAVTAEVSVAKMFLGGILPGILLGLGFIVLIAILSIKHNFPKSARASLVEIGKSFITVAPALLIPAIILAGILSGVFTATESSAIAVFVAFLVGKFFYKELNLKELPNILKQTAINTAIVTFMIAMASIFSWVLTFEKAPQMIAQYIASISDNPFIFLLLTNILFLFIGMIIDAIPALIIMIPVLLPAALHFGIDPIHFGMIACINLTIGLVTPPVGTALFIASAVGQVKIETLTRALIPFLIVAIVALMIITYVPPITLWIPSMVD